MGSFNSTCSISDLSIICGDATYMQLLLPSWVTNPYSIDGEKVGCGEKGLRVSNEGPLGEFVPFGFPIEGHYADYGDIDGIVPTKNTEMLEEFFGISILDIIDCAKDDRWYKHSYKPMMVDKTDEEYKGQYKSWTIGENKMKNIDILKKLTLTYFKKEHYDFLSDKWIGSDSYYEKERNKRFKKMVNILGELDTKRPTSKKRKVFSLNDITDEHRTKYTVIRDEMDDVEFDKMIVEMENHMSERWWKSDWNYTFYIPSISTYDMFKLLPIGSKDVEEVRKQYTFIGNMSTLFKVLRPSYYGSQEDNYDAYVKFHQFSTELVNDKKMELKADTILYDIAWILKENLKNIDKEVADKIKGQIVADIKEEFDLTIKL